MKLTGSMARHALILKKNSPHILFVGGVTAVVAGTVLACRATLKVSGTLDDIQQDVTDINRNKELSPEDSAKYNKDLAYAYLKGGGKLAKLYGPSAIVTATGLGMLTGSHVQMTRRNASLMAAYAVVQEAYNNYRDRIRAELGEERELEIHQGYSTQISDDEDGTRKEIVVRDTNKLSMYSKIFDEYNPNWEKDPEYNRVFLQCQQNFVNHQLQARGHMFLNEVYDLLGFDRTRAGAVVGWIANGDGDNYIDFGLFDNEMAAKFINGWERSIILDFNVDGVIYDLI